MNKKALVLAALAALATGARADYTYDFSKDAADSSAVQAQYSAKTFSDAQTTTTLSVTKGVMRIDVKWANVAAWGANAGILLPLNSSWAVANLSTNLTGITFSYRTSDATTSMQFSFNSPLWTSVVNDAAGKGDGVVRTYAGAASTDWSTVTLDPTSDLVWLDWMKKDHKAEIGQTWADVSSEVKNLQFQPMPAYNSTGDKVSPSVAWMEVKDITLNGVKASDISPTSWRDPSGTCPTSGYVTLSDKKNAPASKNQFGGYWYAFTDTTSGTQANSNGTTSLDTTPDPMNLGLGLWLNDLMGDGSLMALGARATFSKLDKNGKWEAYSGWADVGTNLDTASSGKGAVDLTGLTAISFHIVMGDGAGGDFDQEKIGGVTFKVGKASVADAEQYQLPLSYADYNTADICVALKDLQQPDWYTDSVVNKAGGTIAPFTANDVTKFLWEMKIVNQKSTDIASATASSVWITNVRLYGAKVPDGISSAKVRGAAALSASYNRGLVLSYALEGAQNARIDVVSLDGSKVASFTRSETSAKNLSLPVTLSQGTYLVVVKGGKSNLVAPVSVLH